MGRLSSIARHAPRLGPLLEARDELGERNERLVGENRALAEHLEAAQQALGRCGSWPPGHFYSPHPDLDLIEREQDLLFGDRAETPAGVDIAEEHQLELLGQLAPLSRDQPFGDQPDGRHRYHYANDYFAHGDGLVYHCLLRHVRPSRVVEVGIGYSSALLLDTNDEFLDASCTPTFIDPNPERMLGLLRSDEQALHLIAEPVQKAPPEVFSSLGAGDMLFIDSSHVTKTGNDVNHLYFEVLPSLASGVLVHVHDIFWPFEYPRQWVLGGRAWNEAYLLHAFLIGNHNVEVVWFNDYLRHRHRRRVSDAMAIWGHNPGGSLWFRVR
ncbi:MAG: class I SAM-dependent methyltransferase [Actinomycetota bacterium]|nr:class I SAM-dependent methyltransferase [Actinomycetota bacterium]